MRSLLALALVAILAGCGELEHYETTDGEQTRLDGSEPTMASLSVSAAKSRAPGRRFHVHGYLLLPRDDEHRLCEDLASERGCDHWSSLVLANRHAVERMAADGVLEHGCCAIGSWSPREVVVHVRMRKDGRVDVLG